jgi:hypothetical protein
VYTQNIKNGVVTALHSGEFRDGKNWQKKTGARTPRMVKKQEMTLVVDISDGLTEVYPSLQFCVYLCTGVTPCYSLLLYIFLLLFMT